MGGDFDPFAGSMPGNDTPLWRGEEEHAPLPAFTDEDRAQFEAQEAERKAAYEAAGGAEGAAARRMAEEVAEKRKLRRDEWAEQIPPLLREEQTWDEGNTDRQAHLTVMAWAAQLADRKPPGNLVLAGDYGNGKTWHAWHAVLSAYDGRFAGTAAYVGVRQWRGYSTGSRYDKLDTRLAERFEQVSVLILDDLPGKLKLTDSDDERLFAIIEERTGYPNRPTVVISNKRNLVEAFGGAVTDRLKQPSCTVVVFEHGSYRGGT